MHHLKENGMDSRILALASLFAFGVCAAHAGEPVYKSTMPDGRIIYGESPQPGAKRVAKVAAPPETAGIVVASPQDKDRANAIPTGKAAVGVIPAPVRPPTRSPTQGEMQNPGDKLPTRGY
jgi:hypothetical protein